MHKPLLVFNKYMLLNDSCIVDAHFVHHPRKACNYGRNIETFMTDDLEVCKIWCGLSDNCGGFAVRMETVGSKTQLATKTYLAVWFLSI